MALRILLSVIVWCQCCEGCHRLLPSCDQLAGVSSDRKACLCVLLHRDLLWWALLWCAIRSNGMPPRPPLGLPTEWFWVPGLQHGHQAGAGPGSPGTLCAPLIQENGDTRNWERDPVWRQEITTLNWDFQDYAEFFCTALIKYMLSSYKLLIERKNIFYGIL